LGQLLAGRSTEEYRFTSVEIKELARRIDGVFIPERDDSDGWIYFAEIQFQSDDRLYERLMTETFLYLGQYRPAHLWCCVAIWARASLDGGVPLYYRRLQEIGLLQVVYLDDLPEGESLGVSLLRLVSIEERRVDEVLTVLKGQLVAIADTSFQREIVELIEKVLVYKFPRLTPEELAAMFGQQELEQTRFYQELVGRGLERGLVRGRLEGKLEAIPNMVALGLTAEQIAGALGLELAVVQTAIAGMD